ncbi:shikimate kinase [Alicyclobacillus sacchari]|uniref:Shikimate kinase n=1 Tax=Alicyclobacillus sacchari TaxID=392010 RepID=A0A4R8LL41_9BACL|nr:shikimate kinase [Alicyclobacillus sacchari]TDY43379.1 shikimate kinase [Alicyclobacillus sacchari]GMA55878.1 shikimate kinase [Alicyclobacillus sacchari]
MQRLALIGFMASGKSTVGELVAAKLDVPFVDLDRYIEARAGMTIPEIFATLGEQRFRVMETEALGDIGRDMKCVVLATGGGAVIHPSNRDLLKASFTTVYLRAAPETILSRLKQDAAQRPLLQTDNPAQRVRTLLKQRQTWYEDAASWIVDVDHGTVEEIAQFVIQTAIGE